MGTLATLALITALVFAALDWYSVATNRHPVEAFAKPSVMVLLIAAVVLAGEASSHWLVILGLGCSFVGDVALLERVDRFVAGLAAFLAGHLFYAAAFVTTFDQANRRAAVVGVGLVLLVILGKRGLKIISLAARSDERLRLAVTLYIGALSIMTIAASTNTFVAALGAWLFATSDAVLGWNRFVHPLANGRLATHVLYHLGQTLIAAWAVGL